MGELYQEPARARSYWAKVNYYDSGAVEVTACHIPVNRQPFEGVRIVCGKPERIARDRTAEVVAQDRARAAARARSTVRRLCMTMGADRLLTCTFRRNETSASAAWSCWRRFVRLVRERMPGWRYVVVAERQQRGAFHFHAAVRGYQAVRTLRECWLEAAGDGNIDVTPPRRGVRAVEASGHVARYLAKYLAKAFEDSALGSHRYRASEALKVPVVRFWLDAERWPDAVNEALSLAAGDNGRELRAVYFGDEWSCVWGVGWS